MNFEAHWSNFEGLLYGFEGTMRAIKMKITLRDNLLK